MSSIQRYHVGPRLSEIVVHNNTVYLAGQVAETLEKSVRGQAEEVLTAIDRLLGEVGSDKQKLLSVTIYLADMADYDAMNEAWSAWVSPGHTPARATVEARLADPRYKVEMSVVAAL
ncbi:Enamine deaminase RidA, house cleaning of reactive enamine intermediates, YjgF/YER057c/UK114 family [Andreprevotia lacus DSM 23236]|jgi:enamine deaminase RidA (YjgF/YER057c/UK114 family)|uniref:Enamine deaminase RidA, house cleaning of reactive enamine intermediates, YjgF/YER057c/UK114 family n=1 Tax=Andreprevotia lacus DSM 23236 TaxID=1121001 RepID=A0A1W1XY61_9NEIS|nr:RidA family protein [Andreprevotia lacus]SMC28815.1 Enamine deaminase RidA, house cleaning of reactive enamine intermediates, YjgF/YER057c/UK114 family [Andreprevotia lacus DSM 23236]